MDLVDEEDRSLAGLCPTQASFFDVAPQVGHAGADGAERNKVRRGHPGDQSRQRRLSAARWAPEHHRTHAVLLDGAAQLVFRTNQVLLPDELVERARPHPGGEWLVLLSRFLRGRKERFLRHQLTIGTQSSGKDGVAVSFSA